MKVENRFYSVASMLPPLEKILRQVPKHICDNATEIRVRAGKPVVIEAVGERYICGLHSVSPDEIYSCVKCFCDYSIYSCKRELSEGWITLKGGHRAGLSGTAHYVDGKIETIKDISSLNVRIAREHKGISDNIFEKTAKSADFRGLLIAGPPLSGKTTILRDYCRNCGNNFKTSLVDERNEIAAVHNGMAQNDVGLNTDVLNCYTKKTGIEHAVRVMSPEILICDEIGDEAKDICKLVGNGVNFVFTAHCRDLNDAVCSRVINLLIDCGVLNYIAFVENSENIGRMKGLWYIENGKDIDSCNDGNNLLYYRDDYVSGTKNACASAQKIYCNA